ncbi:MAG: hypothetical protein AAFN93_24055 [Bacteroidota bacterium]
MEKKRVIKSLEKLDPSLKSRLIEEYPDGFEDYLRRLTSAKNEPFYVVPLETDETNYLVKIAVRTNSDGELDVDLEDESIKELEAEFGPNDDNDEEERPAYRNDPQEEDDDDNAKD